MLVSTSNTTTWGGGARGGGYDGGGATIGEGGGIIETSAKSQKWSRHLYLCGRLNNE